MEEDLLQEQNELLRILICLSLDERDQSTEEKAEFLSEFDLTHKQISNILNRDRTTISGYVGGK